MGPTEKRASREAAENKWPPVYKKPHLAARWEQHLMVCTQIDNENDHIFLIGWFPGKVCLADELLLAATLLSTDDSGTAADLDQFSSKQLRKEINPQTEKENWNFSSC
ncbi:hypothetical protein H920_02986 [Fukomys damarensis]|uniref:Uncharacterized protein n=1 Tax=Fukomys damarensis TaxID=885580 RepID=A0A091DYS2_FUKDA|nr:hypothetical protein H920_02986 [Fukomys damarensis]